MKNRHMENLACRMRQHHQRARWYGNAQGLYVPHSFEETEPDDLSWWDDFQFILSGRRVNVWWRHPRMDYQDEIEERADRAIEPLPAPEDWRSLFDGGRTYKKVGRSRKRHTGTIMRPLEGARKAHFEAVEAERRRLTAVGIDYTVTPKMGRERTDWSIFVPICAPFEIRSDEDVRPVANLVRRLLRFETTLAQEFPGYAYTKADWLAEAPRRQIEQERREAQWRAG